MVFGIYNCAMRNWNNEGLNRRDLLRAAAGVPALLGAPGLLLGAEYDLVIRGGRVVDPLQRMDKMADVGIRAGRIAAIKNAIPASAGTSAIDAKGLLVVPGLIDVHLHARDAALPPADIMKTGVTSMIDGGSRGADNVDQLIDVAKNAPNRMRILLNIARLGNNPNGRGEFLDGMEMGDAVKARAAVEKHRTWIVGLKARLSRGVAAERDLEVLRKAVEVAGPLKIPIMIHIGNTASTMPQILALLKKGDIVTHLYAPPPHGIMDDNGRILPEVLAARKRGVLFDFGNGLNEHWTWDVAVSGLIQKFPPDTISTDLTIAGRTDQVFDLPTTVSKFMVMGMPLMDALACVTSNAARAIKEFNGLGTLRTGSAADFTLLELAQGNFDFTDNYKGKRSGMQKLVTRGVVMGGKQVA
jgi:dihydroorotase